MTASPASRQEPRRLRTRAALLQAGAELLSQRPVDAIAVNEIVEAAGVAKGSFFNHFADKDSFAAEIARDIRRDVETRVTAANAVVADPAARMARAICVFVQFALTEPKRARIMLRGQDWARSGGHPLNDGVRADIRRGVAEGRFAERAAEGGVLYVIGVCQTLVMATAAERRTVQDARRLTREMLSLTFAGLGARDAQGIIDSAAMDIVVGPAAP